MKTWILILAVWYGGDNPETAQEHWFVVDHGLSEQDCIEALTHNTTGTEAIGYKHEGTTLWEAGAEFDCQPEDE